MIDTKFICLNSQLAHFVSVKNLFTQCIVEKTERKKIHKNIVPPSAPSIAPLHSAMLSEVGAFEM